MADKHLDRADEESRDSPDERWFTLRVGSDALAIPATEVVEIGTPKEATRVPGAPATVLGLINHRGAVVTVIDLGRLLGKPRLEAADYRLVFLRHSGNLVALAATDVMGFGARADDGSVPSLLDLGELFRGVF